MSTSSKESSSRHHDTKSAKTDISKNSADTKADDSKKKRGNRDLKGVRTLIRVPLLKRKLMYARHYP